MNLALPIARGYKERMSREYRPTTFRLRESDRARLRAAAEASGMSQSAFVRGALTVALDKQKSLLADEHRRHGAGR